LFVPGISIAGVSCNKLGIGVPQTWDCTESQQNSTVGYTWTVEPNALGFFAPYYDTSANPNYKKLMQCNLQEPFVREIEGVVEVRRVRYDGTVKVVRQFGVYIGPLSQDITEATVYCDSPGPTLLALNSDVIADGEGLPDDIDAYEETTAILAQADYSFCGPSGPTNVEYSVGIVIIYCRGGGGGGGFY